MTTQPMTEDELLSGLTDALTLSGWWWMHVRRSDQAIIQGMQGWPDIFAIHPLRGVALAWELKSQTGQATPEQHAWLHAFRAMNLADRVTHPVDVRLVRPSEYDAALMFVLRGRWGA
jgi:hypothetical protein